MEQQQEDHPPEDVSWVQPTESLAFSVSPVVSSSSINAREEEDSAGRKSFSLSSRDGGERGDEEDPPLRGEYIAADGDREGKADSVDDERNVPELPAAPSAPQATTPAGEALRRESLLDDNNEGHSSGHGSGSPPPLASDVTDNGAYKEDAESSGFTNSPPYAQHETWGQQQQQEHNQRHENMVVEERERMLGHLAPQADRSGGEEQPRQVEEEQAAGFLLRQHWEDESRDGHREEWADDDLEDFAPAWDQGRPADFRGGSDGVVSEQEDTDQISRMDSSEDEESRLSSHQHCQQRRIPGRRDFNRRDEGGSDMDVRSGSDDSFLSNADVRDLVDPPQHSTRGRSESPSYRVVRRRTRVSLDRERRRLDRVPRSQRLSQVRGHPLGGMTLLQLEERHLLDVGIGQMTRQLANRRGRRRSDGQGGARQWNEDLLRRSARLLRRAQEERDARFSAENARDFHHSIHASGGSPPSRVFRDNVSGGGGAGPRSAGEEGAKRRGRRPASASRDRSCRRFTSSYSLEPSGGSTRDRAHTASDYSRPIPTDAWGRVLEGKVPPVGLYSGGGTRCSLKQRRPMSAKPALTSGWEPGRARTQGRGDGRGSGGGAGGQWGRFEDDGSREAGFPGRRGTAGGELRGHGDDEEGLNYSDVSDLSPQGIVEYTDEEEGPFNVDELERVAASYLLRPRGSMCFSSGNAVDDDDDDDDRFADDGSVYIYREGDSSPPAEEPPQGFEDKQEDDAEHGGGDDSGRNGRARFAPRHGVDDDDRVQRENDGKLWQNERRLKPSPARTREVGRSSSGGYDWGVSGGDVHRGVSAQRATSVHRGEGGGDVAAGVNSKDSRQGNVDLQAWQQQEQQRLVGPSGGGEDLASTRKYLRSGGGAQQAQQEVGRSSEPSLATLEGRRKTNDRNFVSGVGGFGGKNPAQAVPTPVPGFSYSAKIDRGLQGRGARDAPVARGLGGGDDDDDGALTEFSAKVRQTATRLRNMILDRQASANRSIREVFGHFDRRRCGYVNVAEIRHALADLRLNLSPDEGKELHSMIALDGGDRLSYAEFVVFVTDPYHSELQADVCQQAADQLESLGRRSLNLDAAFRPEAAAAAAAAAATAPNTVSGTWSEMTTGTQQQQNMPQSQFHAPSTTPAAELATGERAGAADDDQQTHGRSSSSGGGGTGSSRDKQGVSAEEFLVGLRSLGLRLSVPDAHRLILRFDVHGDGHLSARRFVSMVENSRPWTRALARLAHQEEADEEADACLRARRTHGEWPPAVKQGRGQSHGQTLALSTDIVEMARYIGIRVSSDSSLLWIAADALAAPLPNGWVMHKSKDGRGFYYNELTGQSRWDHPLDPHFRRMYVRERFGNSDPGGDNEVVLSHEPSTETSRQGTAATAGRSAGGGAAVIALHGGRPPVVLPPRRMRPNVLDFPADKALDNLRARRLNASGSSSSRSTFAAVTGAMAAGPAAVRSANGLNIYNNSSAELWADEKGINDSRQPVSPVRPRRRRPVSATAVCGGLDERGLGQKAAAAAFEAMRPDVSEPTRSEGDGGAGTALHGAPHTNDPQQNQRIWRGGSTSTARTQRPRSARAALQRPPPPLATDYYHYNSNSNSGGARGCEEGYMDQRALQQEKRSRPSSAAFLPQAADETCVVQGLENSGGEASAGRGGGGGGEGRGPAGQRFSRKELLPKGSSSRGVTAPQTPEEEEKAWLRSRLAELCGKLDEAEALATGEYQHQHQHQHQYQHHQHPGPDDFAADPPRDTGAGRGGLGRKAGRPDQPSRQPNAFQEVGGGVPAWEIRPNSDSGRPSSAGFGKDDEVSSNLEGNISGHLRHQVLELSSRMRLLETRLLEQHNPPSSPARDYSHHDDDDDADEQLSSVPQSFRQQHRRSGFPSGERGAIPTSPFAVGTKTAAARKFARNDGGDARGGYKRGSQDDLAYRSPEGHNRASNLSKQSWPPPTASSGTAATGGRGGGTVPVHAPGGRHSSSNSSSESSLAFAARGLTAASPHPRRWEGGRDSAARAASGGRSRSGGGNGGAERGKRGVGRRKGGGSGGKTCSGNPPGIVLI